MLSCCFPFVLSGCAASFSVNAASTAATGTIVPSPDTVDFGTVDVSQSVNTKVSVLNQGSAPVEVSQLSVSGIPSRLTGRANFLSLSPLEAL
jgi:hypothetical protein